jgi:hypothetical protein
MSVKGTKLSPLGVTITETPSICRWRCFVASDQPGVVPTHRLRRPHSGARPWLRSRAIRSFVFALSAMENTVQIPSDDSSRLQRR